MGGRNARKFILLQKTQTTYFKQFSKARPDVVSQGDEGKGEVMKESCAQVNTLGVTLGVFGAVLLLGLLGICAFKGIQMLQYRRECAHFERLVQEAKYATNQTPNEMYRSPITTYKNPMYGVAKPDR